MVSCFSVDSCGFVFSVLLNISAFKYWRPFLGTEFLVLHLYSVREQQSVLAKSFQHQ